MKRVKETSYLMPITSVSAIPNHYVNLTANISATHAVTENGRTFIPAGLCVSNATTLDGRENLSPITAAATAFDGIIFTDYEVAPGETAVNVTVMVHGFAKYSALRKVADTVPTTSKNAMLLVIK